jgi:hypothetical protein
VLPLLPGGHFRSKTPITPKRYWRCLLVGAMPPEFLPSPVALCAFVGLFLAFEQGLVVETPVWQGFSAVDAMANIVRRLPIASITHNFDRLFVSLPDDAITRIFPIIFSMMSQVPATTFSKVCQVVAVSEYCWAEKQALPFEELQFADNMDAFCAQLQTGFRPAIDFLLTATIGDHDVPPIVHALTRMPRADFCSLPSEFVSSLIDAIVATDSAIAAIPAFAAQLPVPLVVTFLEKAPLPLYPAILSTLKFSKDDFDAKVSPFVETLVASYPTLPVTRTICGFKFGRFYPKPLVDRILLLLIRHSHRADTIPDICTLSNCVVQLMKTCTRELMRAPTLLLELVRKLSHSFSRHAAQQPPTPKQLRALAKLYECVVKANGDLLHYLIASFVSHIATAQLDEGRMRAFQGAALPLFARCTRRQLAEVSAALHDAQRQIFQQLYARWEAEARFKGKV